MQEITLADIRGMLRADALELALGTGLVAIALLILGLAVAVRRRIGGSLWLGLFALLYGTRLLIRTDTIRIAVDVAPAILGYLEAAITYVVPIPLLFFSRVVAPEWRRLTTRIGYAVMVFAILAIASDLLLHRPHSARLPNNLITLTLLGLLVGWAFRTGVPASRELSVVRLGVSSFAIAALLDNLRGVGIIHFGGPDLEPVGVIGTLGCLGTLATWRTMSEAQRLVAIDRELSIARDIQSSILPQSMPRVSGISVVARYQPMTAVAGDFYDFLELGQDRLGVLVADVTGHGVPAALIASMVKVALLSQEPVGDRPSAVLAGINPVLCGRLAGRFVTAAYLFIDNRSGLVRYAAAGHPPMLHAASATNRVQRLGDNGILLGFLEDATYPETERQLNGRDRFLLYSDGLIEAANRSDDPFGIERVERALSSSLSLPPDAAADAVLAAKDAWSGLPPEDDLTMVVIDRVRQSG